MNGYLSVDVVCLEMWTVFLEQSSRKTVIFMEQIMSKDKYAGIFLHQIEAIVFIILQIFYNLHKKMVTYRLLFAAQFENKLGNITWVIFLDIPQY